MSAEPARALACHFEAERGRRSKIVFILEATAVKRISHPGFHAALRDIRAERPSETELVAWRKIIHSVDPKHTQVATALQPDSPQEGVYCLEPGARFRLEIDPVRPQSGRRRPKLDELHQWTGRHVVGWCALSVVQRGACARNLAVAQLT